jgi:integrase
LETLHVTRLAQITVERFEQFRTRCKQQGHAPRTLDHESVVVKQFLRWCCRRHWLSTHPLADVKLGKPVMEPRGGPSLEQVNAGLEAARSTRRLQYALLAFTGMRSGECQRLRPEDVDLSGNRIHVASREGAETKTRRSRKVPIHARLRALLGTIPRTDRPWFFTANPSNRYPEGDHWINPKKLKEDFVKLVTRLGIPAGRDGGGFTIHSLRHFFETHCVNAGIPQRVIDTWLGHGSDQSMAAKYYRLRDEDSQAFMAKVPFGTGTPAADAGHTEG